MARHWIQYLPWEFETIPDEWVQALNANASEVWAPSNYVRNGFIESGLDPNKVYYVHRLIVRPRPCLELSTGCRAIISLDMQGGYI